MGVQTPTSKQATNLRTPQLMTSGSKQKPVIQIFPVSPAAKKMKNRFSMNELDLYCCGDNLRISKTLVIERPTV